MGKHKTKILLMHPAAQVDLKIQEGLKYPPLGLAFLSSVARNKGYSVQLFDANIEKNPLRKLEKILKEYAPDVVGISFTSLLAESAHFLAGFIKQLRPEVTIIAGGYHPTVMPLDVINDSNFDFIVVGEGENTFVEWLDKYEADENGYEMIDGLVYKKGNEIIQTKTRKLIPDIDSIPVPSYDLLNLTCYSSLVSTRKPFTTFIRSRGCPFRCIFCGVQKMFGCKYRCQSPEKTISDIDTLVRDFRIKEILFKDSDFLIDRSNVEALCELLAKRKYDLVWSCNARVDTVNEQVLKLMKRAGCKIITYGIESGNQDILNNLKKDITLAQTREAIDLTKKAGIQCTANIIFGSPGETRETVEQTLRFVKQLDPDYASFTYLTAFPGSILYDEALRNNWFIDGKPDSYAYEQLRLNATAMSNKELSAILKYAARYFYLRPGYILKKLRQLTFAELMNNLRGLWAIINNY